MTPHTLLEIARSYAHAGLRLIPLHHLSKSLKYDDSWKHYPWDRAYPMPTDAHLVQWFHENQYNIGIVLGHHGVSVIDIDTNDERIWSVVKRQLETTYRHLPIVQSPHGYHIYYRTRFPISFEPLCTLDDHTFSEHLAYECWVVAPPSTLVDGKYVLIRGSLCHIPRISPASVKRLLQIGRMEWIAHDPTLEKELLATIPPRQPSYDIWSEPDDEGDSYDDNDDYDDDWDEQDEDTLDNVIPI